jgi:hypothetical protein
MTLTPCPDCGREISDQATICPGCGRPLAQRFPANDRSWPPYFYEYRTRSTLFGLPLVHVFIGPIWLAGFRPARGIVAVGNIAVGVAAFGGVAVGLAAFGGVSLGLLCIGGLALGLGLGVGGLATGYWAVGGVAIGVYAIGGLALQNDPQLLRAFRAIFGQEPG